MSMNVAFLVWGQACFLLGISGNFFVLYATIAHKAIKLDPMSTWIIKNLAVIDICNCLFALIPAIAVEYGESEWVFGAHLCYVYAVFQYTFGVANIVLITGLSVNKLLRCKYPLRNLHPTKLQRMMVPGFTSLTCLIPMMWIVVGLVKGFMVLSYFGEEEMVPATGTVACSAIPRPLKEMSLAIKVVAAVVPFLCNGIFCLTLVITTTELMVYAIKKTNRPINKRNITIVISVTISFLASFLPLFMVSMLWVTIPTIFKGNFHKYYNQSWSLTFVSTWINPVIYLVMNQSFRNFTKQRSYEWVRRSRDDSRQQPRTKECEQMPNHQPPHPLSSAATQMTSLSIKLHRSQAC